MNRKFLLLLAMVLLWLSSTVTALAQDDPDPIPDGAPIELEGAIEDVIDEDTVVVGGLTVNVTNVDVSITQQLDIDVEISISGILANGVVYAQTIIIVVVVPEVPVPEATEVVDDDEDDDDEADVDVDIEKYVATENNISWNEADSAPGPEAEIGSEVNFRIVITNDGIVPLSNLTLSDLTLDTSSCEIPETLEPDATFECLLGPVIVVEGQNTNTATVTAVGGDVSVEASDSANYFGGELEDDTDGGVIIVIEGPVVSVNVNIITIYDFDIVLAEDDPLLSVIVIGDIIRVEGQIDDITDGVNITIVVIAVTIIFVDIDIFILDGDVWRDDGNCSNPPPPWAPANGWRRRCEGGGGNGGGNGSGSGSGS